MRKQSISRLAAPDATSAEVGAWQNPFSAIGARCTIKRQRRYVKNSRKRHDKSSKAPPSTSSANSQATARAPPIHRHPAAAAGISGRIVAANTQTDNHNTECRAMPRLLPHVAAANVDVQPPANTNASIPILQMPADARTLPAAAAIPTSHGQCDPFSDDIRDNKSDPSGRCLTSIRPRSISRANFKQQ